MRSALLPIATWLGVLQSIAPRFDSVSPLDLTIRIVGAATVLGSLTVMIYRLGVWRQEMENTRNNVGAAVRAHRSESNEYFARFERRLDAIDHSITVASEQRVRAIRWQTRTDRRLDRLETRLSDAPVPDDLE
jgi:hypothetical protein